jgi:hypothetical protein
LVICTSSCALSRKNKSIIAFLIASIHKLIFNLLLQKHLLLLIENVLIVVVFIVFELLVISPLTLVFILLFL